jgi:hypothetical protein
MVAAFKEASLWCGYPGKKSCTVKKGHWVCYISRFIVPLVMVFIAWEIWIECSY